MGKNEHELFRLLDRPEIPLHSNLSERDIRDYVKKERSVGAREVKRGISFWEFLTDLTGKTKQIPLMADIIQAVAYR